MPITGDMSYLVSEIKIETCHLMLQLVNGLGNPWVQEPYPYPTQQNPDSWHGYGFCWVGYGLLVGFCVYVPLTGNPWVTFEKSISCHNNLRKVFS
jgi:hypothetical protein